MDKQLIDFCDLTYFKDIRHPDYNRFIHIDAAYSTNTLDVYGLAAGYCILTDNTIINEQHPDLINEEDAFSKKDRQYFIDFAVGITAPKGQEVSLTKVQDFIEYLIKKCNYPVACISADQFQSKQTLQNLQTKGFNTEYISVDRTRDPYLFLRYLIHNKQVSIAKNDYLKLELRKLRDDGKKIDHPVACFVGDTKIKLVDGRSVSINDLMIEQEYKQNWVYTFNEQTKKIEPKKIKHVVQSGITKNLVKVTLDNGEVITCTPEHLFPIKNPNFNDDKLIYENGIAYKQAQFLTEEDELISENNAFVYQLIDNRPDSSNYGKPFYIGISSHNNKFVKSFSWKYHRPFTHFTQKSLKQDKNFIKSGIIKKILDLGLNPSVEIISENLTLKEALDLEKTLIRKYGKICDNSGILSNISDGGEGVIFTTSEIIHRKSEKIRETKQKQAEERKNKKNKEWENLIHNKFGYLSIIIICLNHMEQTRLKKSIAAKSPERVKKSRRIMIEYNKSELHRQRTALQNSLKPKISSLKSRAKLSISQSATWNKKSEKEKLENNISKSLGRAWNVLKRIEADTINENIFNIHRSKGSRLANTEPMWNTIVNKLGGIDNFLKEIEHRYGRRFIYEN